MNRDVIVIGGGVIGAATAYRLARDGAAVSVLEAERIGGGTTAASFAWLNANDKPPFEYHMLNVSGMHEYRRLAAELGAAPWLHWTGNTEWDATAGKSARLCEKVERLRAWGYPAEMLPVRELRALEPDLAPPAGIDEFAHFPGEGYVDPVHLTGVLMAHARAAGAEVRPGTKVTELLRGGDRVVGVCTSDGERLHADVVVSCAGRWSDELAAMAGIELPLAPTVGMVAVSAPAAVRLRAVHHNEGMNIRPDGAGRVMMRHAEFDARVRRETPVDAALTAELLDRVVRVLPGLAGTPVEAVRVANRAIPGDQYSVVGPAPGVEGLYFVVTHSAVTLGPLLGRMVSREILAGEADVRLARFRPERLVQPVLA